MAEVDSFMEVFAPAGLPAGRLPGVPLARDPPVDGYGGWGGDAGGGGGGGGCPPRPLASAHLAHRELCGEEVRAWAGERAYILRVEGEDVAALVSGWVGFSAPRRGTPGTPGQLATDNSAAVAGIRGIMGSHGTPGWLALRLIPLRPAAQRGAAVRVRVDTHSLKPPAVVEVPLHWVYPDQPWAPKPTQPWAPTACLRAPPPRPTVNLEDGQLTGAPPQGLPFCTVFGMAAAALYVLLQPRFRPSKAAGSDVAPPTAYPPWCARQTPFSWLCAAGGEKRPWVPPPPGRTLGGGPPTTDRPAGGCAEGVASASAAAGAGAWAAATAAAVAAEATAVAAQDR